MASPEFISYQINHNQTAINAVGDKVDDVKTDVGAVKTDVGAVKADVEAVKADVEAIKTNVFAVLKASEVVRESHTSEISGVSKNNIVVPLKACLIGAGGRVRVKGELKSSGINGKLIIRVNGVEFFSHLVASSGVYSAFVGNIPVEIGGLLEFCVSSPSSGDSTLYLKNLRVCYDVETRSDYSAFV